MSDPIFGVKEIRLARLCADCKKSVATRRIIYPKTGQVMFLCEKCAEKRGKTSSSN